VHKQAWSIENYRYVWDVSLVLAGDSRCFNKMWCGNSRTTVTEMLATCSAELSRPQHSQSRYVYWPAMCIFTRLHNVMDIVFLMKLCLQLENLIENWLIWTFHLLLWLCTSMYDGHDYQWPRRVWGREAWCCLRGFVWCWASTNINKASSEEEKKFI
jgi:hypothetical protein